MNMQLPFLILLLPLVIGCRSSNVNPPTARPNTGYVDFYCPSNINLSWEVEEIHPPRGEATTLFSDLMPLERTPLRLAFPPGSHRLRITFLNRTVRSPALVDAKVMEGMITPVRVTLQQIAEVTAKKEEIRFRKTVSGYAQGPERENIPAGIYRVNATAEKPHPYRPKDALTQYQ